MSYPVRIKRCPEAKVTSLHGIYQRGGVGQVGLRRSASEVLQGDAVDSRVSRSSQLVTQDPAHIQARHCNTARGAEVCRGEERSRKTHRLYLQGHIKNSSGCCLRSMMNHLTSMHGIYVYLELIWSCEKTFNGTEVEDVSQHL